MMNNSQGASSFFSGLSTLLGRPHPLLHNLSDTTFLPGGDLSDEERLLELQTQQTDSRASLNFGLSYQFGSIFNNGVNNRFPRGGGRGNF